mmetsp:Transcript_14062/g.16295  ORF Transcript_14062/g.16295 Transcript_14062/m.16295 type:complete len:165 (+) Transcript_14062:753-1247(+)
MNIHFCVKHYNNMKIESHMFFFRGFCQMMNPTFCQIIDCGSIVLQNSVSKIVMYMETYKNVGGACGHIEALIPDKIDGKDLGFFESVVGLFQYLEYKIGNYLDKSMEAVFGYISVLPGAYSTFRWEALKGDPIKAFLKGSRGSEEEKNFSCFEANQYLAEDRIM